MIIEETSNQAAWDRFLSAQRHRPFLQSWTMGEVYRDCGEEPIRLIAKEGETIVGTCQAIIVDAKRGKHLAVPYGPVTNSQFSMFHFQLLIESLKKIAQTKECTFIRMSPFWPATETTIYPLPATRSLPSPLHLLAEHIWYVPLRKPDPWQKTSSCSPQPATATVARCMLQESQLSEEQLLSPMRKTTRNLIRRAEKEGVTIEASKNPQEDISHFLALHDETRKRHTFTPYSNAFFRAQVARFAPRNECSLYLARYRGQVIASSVHMHAFGETSYHHGASSHAFTKIPASYLLQWTAMRDALKRRDHVYNFWGIAPIAEVESGKWKVESPRHPFAGVTLFKMGFGGKLLHLMHCQDIPMRGSYYLTRGFEIVRKWKRGF